jgi:hypothetical protein
MFTDAVFVAVADEIVNGCGGAINVTCLGALEVRRLTWYTGEGP